MTPNDAALGSAVSAALAASHYDPLGRLETSVVEGTVVLRGHLSSYFLKQMAQVIVARVAGVDRIVNDTVPRARGGR